MNKDQFPTHLEVQIYEFWDLFCSKIMEFDLKWVHLARYELILRLDGALWLRIIFKPLLDTKKGPTTHLMYTGAVTTKIPYTHKKPVPI